MPWPTLEQFAVSPCSNPELPLEEALAAYSAMGFGKFEAFVPGWARSGLDWRADPAVYRALGERYGMRFTSMHLPVVMGEQAGALDDAIAAARFAAAIGAKVVLFKASSRAHYIATARRFLDAIEGLGVTPVLQNHYGQPITTLADYREVLEGIDDPRMKTLLEVGHFHTVGVHWREGYELLKGRIALIHIKDQVGPTPVPFGEGEVDLAGLFQHMSGEGYRGDYVVEMEVVRDDSQRTFELLRQARTFIQRMIQG